MKTINYKLYSAIEKIIERCVSIEEFSKDKVNDYDKIIDILISNLYNNDKELSNTIKSAIIKEGKSSNIYQYSIAQLIKNSHSKSPDYEGRDSREELIDTFLNSAKSKMMLHEV